MENKYDESFESAKAVGEALKEPFRRVVKVLLGELDISGEVEHRLIMDLLPLWRSLNKEKKSEIGITIAGRYNLAKFLVLMEELSSNPEQ